MHLLPGTALVRWLLLALLTLSLGFLSGPAMGQAIIEIDASPIGGTNVRPTAINSAGDVVGSFRASDAASHAFVWKGGVLLDIDTDPRSFSTAFGINDAGVVVGEVRTLGGDTVAFRWSAPGPMVRLMVFDGSSISGRESTARDINNNGVIVGFARAPSPSGLVDRAYRLSGFGPGVQIGGLSAFISRAIAINNLDQIVGESDAPNFVRGATFWDPSAVQLGTAAGRAWDINDAGNATVGYRFNGRFNVPALWSVGQAEMRLALLPGHVQGQARGVRNHSLEIVGFSADFSGPNVNRAVRWRGATHTLEDLNDLLPANSGWVLELANGINERGQITGFGTLNGERSGFMLDPDPEPEPEPEPPAVLFVHGILANNMYLRQSRVWPPDASTAFFDLDLMKLRPDGTRDIGIVPKEQDIMLEQFNGVNIYLHFVDFMNGLRDAGRVSDWYAYSYDWRLRYEDILAEGAAYQSDCVGLFAPTCEQCKDALGPGACVRLDEKIVELADPNGGGNRKVWIVAHSNGGLLIKTLLSQQPYLRDYLEGLILVGSPQLGTPQSLPPALHGEEYPLMSFLTLKDNIQVATRAAGRTWPMSYLLLPSPEYFERVLSPVVTFNPTGRLRTFHPSITRWDAQFPQGISTFEDVQDFLLGIGRFAPEPSDVETPDVIDRQLFLDAELAHDEIDFFDPSAFEDPLPVYQIVGWGVQTTRGIQYRPTLLADIGHKKLYTCDGDGTVVLPSARALSNATTFFIDFPANNRFLRRNRRHKNMLEPDAVQELVARIIEGRDTAGIEFISRTQPTKGCDGIRLRTRSPAEIHIFQDGLHTGPSDEQDPNSKVLAIEEEIPNSQYHSLGEGREAIVDSVGTYDVLIKATGTGTVTLEGDRFRGDEDEEILFVPLIPIRTGSQISFLLDPNQGVPPEIRMDVEGDGTPDFVLSVDAPVETEVFLAVLRSVVEKLDADTATAGFSEKTEHKLRHGALRKALRALREASEEQERRRTDEVVEELERVEKLLERYQERLRRAVARGRAREDAAEPLLEQASQINDLAATSIARVGPVDDDRDDDDSDDDDSDDDDSDDD